MCDSLEGNLWEICWESSQQLEPGGFFFVVLWGFRGHVLLIQLRGTCWSSCLSSAGVEPTPGFQRVFHRVAIFHIMYL